MTMSRDRIKFFLPARYFQCRPSSNNMSRETCIRVLYQAFGLARCASIGLMERNRNGFDIVCRPSQFGRFITYRYTHSECVNGVRDLKPKLIKKPSLYDKLAEKANVHKDDVKAVLQAANITLDNCDYGGQDYVDVSNNDHLGSLT